MAIYIKFFLKFIIKQRLFIKQFLFIVIAIISIISALEFLCWILSAIESKFDITFFTQIYKIIYLREVININLDSPFITLDKNTIFGVYGAVVLSLSLLVYLYYIIKFWKNYCCLSTTISVANINIKIIVGDVYKQKGTLVIPMGSDWKVFSGNMDYLTSPNRSVIATILNKFYKSCKSKILENSNEIYNKLEQIIHKKKWLPIAYFGGLTMDKQMHDILKEKNKGQYNKRYDKLDRGNLGDAVCISHNERNLCFLITSIIEADGNRYAGEEASCYLDERIWTISQTHHKTIIMPVIGTGYAKNPTTKNAVKKITVIYNIINSFIYATQKENGNFFETLTICVCTKDFIQEVVNDWEDLNIYLQYLSIKHNIPLLSLNNAT